MSTHHYSPGDWLCLSTSQVSALVDLPLASPLVERCWSLLSASDSGPDDDLVTGLLEILTSDGLAATPDLALCAVDEHDLRIVVRGQASVELDLDGTTSTVDASRPG